MPDTLAASVFAEMESLGTPLSAREKFVVAMEEAKIHLQSAITAQRKGHAQAEAVAKAAALAALELVSSDDCLIDELYDRDQEEYWAAWKRGEIDSE